MVLGRKIEGSWKSQFPKVVLTSYLIVSALFIVFTLYNMFKVGVYQAGYNRAAYDISAQSQLPASCQSGIALPTTDGKGATLINVTCLQQAPATQSGATLAPEAR